MGHRIGGSMRIAVYEEDDKIIVDIDGDEKEFGSEQEAIVYIHEEIDYRLFGQRTIRMVW